MKDVHEKSLNLRNRFIPANLCAQLFAQVHPNFQSNYAVKCLYIFSKMGLSVQGMKRWKLLLGRLLDGFVVLN